ncbi:extracellular solute-binding protein [Numidum massiliense]|uniref:extracellular solute-binding protein n=1 Tax=Numidum massiliense TaxID=1522315 RepID=UPI0006D537A3|nr:extracellular solute-binding protein [Numidum massiliense]
MKKCTVVGIIAVLLVSLIACSSTDPVADRNRNSKKVDKVSDISGTVRVALAGWQLDDGIDALTGAKSIGFNTFVKETFNQMYPNIKLEVTQIPWENAQAKQKALLLSKDVDVLYTGGAFASQFYQQGLLRDIDDLIEQDKDFNPDIYLKGLWENSYSTRSLDGTKQFGLPTVLGKRAIVYDKKIFDDWGVEYLSDHPTPEEVLEKAKRMTGKNPKTGKKNYGLWFSGNNINQSTFVALSYAYKVDGGIGSLDDLKNIEWKIDTPEMKKVLAWLEEAAKYAPKAFVNGQGIENFGLENNDVAIALDNGGGSAFTEYRSSGNTELIERFVPVLNLGPNGEGWVAMDPVIMAKDVKDVDSAWEVMKFLAGYETQRHNYENFLMTPTLKEADFTDSKDVYTKKAMEIAEHANPTLMDEANPFYNSKMVPQINGFISDAASGKAPDIKKLLSKMQQEAVEWSKNQK